jgi:hypothetical protein
MERVLSKTDKTIVEAPGVQTYSPPVGGQAVCSAGGSRGGRAMNAVLRQNRAALIALACAGHCAVQQHPGRA